jgi:hypothetical protein
MRRNHSLRIVKGILSSLLVLGCMSLYAQPLPVRGVHLGAPAPDEVALLAGFIREDLPKAGVNVLVLEINYKYEFSKRPELRSGNVLTKGHVGELLAASKEAGITLIPQFNCLGHQSWKENTSILLTTYPEFDETPGLYPGNDGIYCRSYCPRHPQVHRVVFDLIDELVEVFEARAFHVGMDEVFLLGEDICPRCRGTAKATLFAEEVNRLHRHLAEKGVTMWMWADRFLNGKATGIGKWEASENETAPAIDQVPHDIVMCDWHYDSALPTASFFALKGFPVVSSPWRKAEVGLTQLQYMRLGRTQSNAILAPRFLGILQTTWTNPAEFIRAYREANGAGSMIGGDNGRRSATEAAECFRQVFAAIRQLKGASEEDQ